MTKYQKMPILHHISANSHTCWSDARTFVGSTNRLEVTITVCCKLGCSRFNLPKIGGWTNLWSLVIIYVQSRAKVYEASDSDSNVANFLLRKLN